VEVAAGKEKRKVSGSVARLIGRPFGRTPILSIPKFGT